MPFMYFRFFCGLTEKLSRCSTWATTPIHIRRLALQEVARLLGFEMSWRTAKTLVDSFAYSS